MSYHSRDSIECGYAALDGLRPLLAQLRAIKAELDRVPGHVAEDDCDGSPIDTLSDAIAEVDERIDAIAQWIGVREPRDA